MEQVVHQITGRLLAGVPMLPLSQVLSPPLHIDGGPAEVTITGVLPGLGLPPPVVADKLIYLCHKARPTLGGHQREVSWNDIRDG